LQELVDDIAEHREEKVLKVIRWLLDNNEIHYDADHKLLFSK
jgi:hypothetical protein